MKKLAFALLLLATPVFAQQQPDPAVQSIANTIGQLTIQNAQLSAQREALAKELTDLKKQLEELKKPASKPQENSDAEKVRSHP